jgi:transcriptional regulator with XRE-family HTH domain
MSERQRGGSAPAVVPGGTELGSALVRWRERAGLSRLAAARRLGVSHPTLRAWELSLVCPQPLQVRLLAQLLDMDVDQVRAQAGEDRVRTVRTSGGSGSSPLCRARLAAGLTTTQLARKVGVGPATVSRWENGGRVPALAMQAHLAAALRMSPEDVAAAFPAPRSRRVDGRHLPGIRQLRRDRGLTQRAFAAALGLGATTVGSWEQGRVRVPLHRVDDVAGVLGIDRSTLLETASGPPRGADVPPLTALRQAAGLTQRELVSYLRVAARTVIHWEAGTRPVPLSAVRPLARYLRRPMQDVLDAAGVERPSMPHPSTWRTADVPLVVQGLREASGLSAASLGRRLGVSGRVVRNWETGCTPLPLSRAQRLELVLGLPRGALSRLLSPAGGTRTAAVSGRSSTQVAG